MAKGKKKLIIVFLFLALASLLSFSIGGEFLHNYLHHHKDQGSHDNCSISQLQVQAFIVVGVIFITFLIKITLPVAVAHRLFVIKPHRVIPFSHAPPIVTV